MTESNRKFDTDQAQETSEDRSGDPAGRRPWVRPQVADLPKLSDLTLDTFGDPVGGGSSVFT